MSVLLLWSPYFYSVSVKFTIHVFEEKVVAGRSVEVPDEVLLGLTISAFSALDSASVQKIAIVISHLELYMQSCVGRELKKVLTSKSYSY